jgi:outer membrane protein OmpA-like peptidoglycan-associated protein
MGLVALGALGALTLPHRLSSMQAQLQTRVNKQLSAPAHEGVVAVVNGQEATVYLSEDYKGADDAIRLKSAEMAVSNLKGLEGLTKQGGWFYGPITKVAIAEGRVNIAALEAEKGISFKVVPDKVTGAPAQANASSASSEASLNAVHDEAMQKCNDRIEAAINGRTLSFKSEGGLTPDSNDILDDLTAALHQCEGQFTLNIDGLELAGESDAKQGPAYQRAQAVADALVLRGYDPYRLSVGTRAPQQAAKDGQRSGRQVTIEAVAG